MQRKIEVGQILEGQRPQQLKPLTKALTDTIKMIAYRAETALVAMTRKHLAKPNEARALIRELLVSDADLIPNKTENTLTVKVHRMAIPAHDHAIEKLLDELTSMNFTHPDNGMKVIYQLV